MVTSGHMGIVFKIKPLPQSVYLGKYLTENVAAHTRICKDVFNYKTEK